MAYGGGRTAALLFCARFVLRHRHVRDFSKNKLRSRIGEQGGRGFVALA